MKRTAIILTTIFMLGGCAHPLKTATMPINAALTAAVAVAAAPYAAMDAASNKKGRTFTDNMKAVVHHTWCGEREIECIPDMPELGQNLSDNERTALNNRADKLLTEYRLIKENSSDYKQENKIRTWTTDSMKWAFYPRIQRLLMYDTWHFYYALSSKDKKALATRLTWVDGRPGSKKVYIWGERTGNSLLKVLRETGEKQPVLISKLDWKTFDEDMEVIQYLVMANGDWDEYREKIAVGELQKTFDANPAYSHLDAKNYTFSSEGGWKYIAEQLAYLNYRNRYENSMNMQEIEKNGLLQ